MPSNHHHEDPSPLFVGDDLALDFINSAYGVGEAHRDHLASPAGLVEWLNDAGLPLPETTPTAKAELHRTALELRDNARHLVAQRKQGGKGDAAPLNRVLASGNAYDELVWTGDGAPHMATKQRSDDPRAALLPIATAIASLLSTADFQLVRQCESDDCTLWFHDRTRSHRRRWCSQATCGNRMKVAAFRARKRG